MIPKSVQRFSDKIMLNRGGSAMRLPRRTVLRLAAGAAALPAVSRIARAQAYPSRPVRIIVGFPPGGATDIQARLMGQWLSERLGQQFIIENRAGASGNIGTEAAAKSPADGYTLLQIVTPNVINPALYTNLNFDFMRDIAPVICVARLAYVVVVHPSVPAATLGELIAHAKANPGKINYGSAGPGTPQNIACELFKMMTGVNLVHVPYRGGAPAVTDLIGGHLQVIFCPVSEAIEHVKTGKLRALAVTTAARLEVFPDVPTVADTVPGYEATGLAGLGVPRGTPAEIIDLLNKECNAGVADAKVKARIVDLGGTVAGGSAAEFGTILTEATEKWAKVIKFAGIKVE
jgi:tripartite-type tricarboxylate transporter receptor subunit TctC